MSNQENRLERILEAVLFSSDAPLTAAKLGEICGDCSEGEVKKAISHLNDEYDKTGRSFQVKQIAGGFQMFTRPDYAPFIEKLFAQRQKSRLSQKALETLAIIAYKQPVTRMEVEAIRGVNADGIIRTLLSRNLIAISGRANAPGSPFLYKTTRQFLEYFGLSSLKDLPKLKEIDEIIDENPEIQEKYGEFILQQIVPESLGLDSNPLVGENGKDGEESAKDED